MSNQKYYNTYKEFSFYIAVLTNVARWYRCLKITRGARNRCLRTYLICSNVLNFRNTQVVQWRHRSIDRNLPNTKIIFWLCIKTCFDTIVLSSLCVLYRIYLGECSEELFDLVPTAEFSNRTVRPKLKYHPHHLEMWQSTTVWFRF